MSKKNTKTKSSTKAAAKPKARKAKATDAAPQAEEATTTENATAESAGETAPDATATAAPEDAAAAPAETEVSATMLTVKKDANGRFWVVPKDSGQEHGPYDTKKEAVDAKDAIASGSTPAKAKKVKEPKPKKVSAIDAAAQILATSSEPMNCMALVEAMATQGLWTSPGGATPHATLYSAIIREIATKGAESRFVKKDRGMFAAANA